MHVYEWNIMKTTFLVLIDPETCRHFKTGLWFLHKNSNSKHWNYTCKTVFSNGFPCNCLPSSGSSICANGPVHSPVRLSGGGGRCHPCSPAPEHCRLWGRSEEWVCGDTLRGQVCGTVAPGSPRQSWTISASDLQNIFQSILKYLKA